MAPRGRPIKRLNDQRPAVVHEQILKENPDFFADVPPEPVVIAKKIPEMRRVQFLNGRDPGYALDFHYHSGTHYLKQYKLLHGHEYDLPVEIIEHLEERNEPQYAYRVGESGHPEMYIKARKYIFQLRPVVKRAT